MANLSLYATAHLMSAVLLTNPSKAGLFAGINTAFIALTLVIMAPDPLQDISSLLQQLIEGLKSPMSLPSVSFAPALNALVINAVFALSLALALFASFFTVLGKQWLTLYRHRDGGGVDRQRWEQLRRSLGTERWRLVPVLEILLPIFIQGALSLFAIGFFLFLRTMNETLAICALVPLLIASFLVVLAVVSSLVYVSCPFKSPLSEGIIWILSGVSWSIRWFWRARAKRRIQAMQAKRGRGQISSRSQEVRPNEEDKRNGTVRGSTKDEETGDAAIRVLTQSVSPTPTIQKANRSRSTRGGWMLLRNWRIWRRMREMINSNLSFRKSFKGLWWGRQIGDDRVLEVESIKRVINVSEDPSALYYAALNLRSITDLRLLKLVSDDETTTRGLRECYFEAVEELERKKPSDKQYIKLLRETLALGTAFFHVALSADSFDDFIAIMGMKEGTLPLRSFAMSPWEAHEAGENCRRAQSFVRQFMNLQLRQLGSQPVAMTSTTLAANAFWYAVNGIPHSQDLVYGDQFRKALTSSEVSWAGLELLASVSNNTCKFSDASQSIPYGIKELDWYREAFLRVREAYYSSEPTQELANAIHDSLSTGKNPRSNAILFKFSWRMFSNDDEDNLMGLGERALSEGHILLCALEKAIRRQKAITANQVIKYKDAMAYLKANIPEQAANSMEALSVEVAISEEEATRALQELSAWTALKNDPHAASTSEVFRGAFRAAIGALAAIGARASLVGLEARIASETKKNPPAQTSSQAQANSETASKMLEEIRSQPAIGPLSATRSQSATPAPPMTRALDAIFALLAIHSQSATRATPMTRALAAIRAWSVFGSRTAIRALTAARQYHEITSPQDAIGQAATSARKMLRALKATEEHKNAREMCFEAMIGSMGSSDAKFSILKHTAWRQRLALKTATEYMNYIMTNEEGDYSDNAFAKDVMTQIRDAQIQDKRVVSALGTEHAKIKQKFEDTFSKFSKWLSETSGADGGLQQPERGSADLGISPADGQSASISTLKEQ
ncbi:hypothetical protein FRC01_004383 [Tulasnella sp. 417]|nr:hypothetical protein FRC01_004383 [Tulasnella sp. 417]